ncbi:MAG: hypothetical protein AB1571_00065 [Nanoarchaeota archaeon]
MKFYYIPFEQFQRDYISRIGSCKHHDKRFKEGWIPWQCVPYAKSIKREKNDKLTKKIIELLEDHRKIIFEEIGNLAPSAKLIEAIDSLVLGLDRDTKLLLYDYHGFNILMLDRKAYTTDGELIKPYIQFYFRELNQKSLL